MQGSREPTRAESVQKKAAPLSHRQGYMVQPGSSTARRKYLVGRENVIAGVDCGFATFAGAPTVVPTIAWAKLGTLAEGACPASAKLWARPS